MEKGGLGPRIDGTHTVHTHILLNVDLDALWLRETGLVVGEMHTISTASAHRYLPVTVLPTCWRALNHALYIHRSPSLHSPLRRPIDRPKPRGRLKISIDFAK